MLGDDQAWVTILQYFGSAGYCAIDSPLLHPPMADNIPEDLFARLLDAAEQVKLGGGHRLTTDRQGRQRLTHSNVDDYDGAGFTQMLDNDDSKSNASDLSTSCSSTSVGSGFTESRTESCTGRSWSILVVDDDDLPWASESTLTRTTSSYASPITSSLKSLVTWQRLILVFLVLMALAVIGMWSLSSESLRANADGAYTFGFGALPFGKLLKERLSFARSVGARDKAGSIFHSSV